MKTEIIKGEKIKKRIPKIVLQDIKLSFEDHGMDFAKDLQHCNMHITLQGTCWIHDTNTKRFNWNGTLIATFSIDGSHFFFTKNMERNSSRLHDYQEKRRKFFEGNPTAGELKEFEEQNKL